MGKSDTAIQNPDSEEVPTESPEPEPKPILWVGLTATGRAFPDDDHLDHLAERVQEAVGNDYAVVAADDRVRLADVDDLEDLRNQVGRLHHELQDLEGGELD